jgi:hypothetical protein
MTTRKLIITNLVYGERYAELFLEQHLKSLLDETNIPRFRDRVEYVVFTDEETLPLLNRHASFFHLKSLVPTHIVKFPWNSEVNKFDQRYQLLIQTFRESVRGALQQDAILSAMVADLTVAKGYLGKLLAKFDQGYGAVFCLPVRSAAETMVPSLKNTSGALDAERLFELAYANIHPLWIACHWGSPTFTKLPFTLIWNSGDGLLARTFAVTPIAFLPSPAMLNAQHVIDVEVPSLCKNPYWAYDWLECPTVAVELLHCYYPPFSHEPASVDKIVQWARENLHPDQRGYLKGRFCFPRTLDSFTTKLQESDQVVSQIRTGLGLTERASQVDRLVVDAF